MKVECKCNSNFELTKEKGSHRKFLGEILIWTMKPPHCLTQKCQKLSQFVNLCTHASEITFIESHQQQIRT
jgi:hypothetical protein